MLKVVNYHKAYGELQVLKGVNFEVKKGEVIAIIGPSGSGKSTLLKTINYLVTPDQGTLHYHQHAYQPSTIHKKDIISLRRNMGMVFQNFGLFTHLTVLENLTLVLNKIKKIKGLEAETLAKLTLEKVGLSDKLNAYPNQLSGGQQQRVGIARALVTNPDLLLFDEPTSALDPELVGEVLRVIKDLAKQGNTMILVTHEMTFAKEVADRILFMDQGVLIADDHPDAIFSETSHPRIQQFLNNYVI